MVAALKNKPDYHQCAFLAMLAVFTAACDLYFQGGNNGFAALLAKAAVHSALFLVFFLIAEKSLDCCEKQTEMRRWHSYFRFTKKSILRLSLLFFTVYFELFYGSGSVDITGYKE